MSDNSHIYVRIYNDVHMCECACMCVCMYERQYTGMLTDVISGRGNCGGLLLSIPYLLYFQML